MRTEASAGTGVGVAPPTVWYLAFSLSESAFHRRLKSVSLSPLVRLFGRSGRCCVQNAWYALAWPLFAPLRGTRLARCGAADDTDALSTGDGSAGGAPMEKLG